MKKVPFLKTKEIPKQYPQYDGQFFRDQGLYTSLVTQIIKINKIRIKLLPQGVVFIYFTEAERSANDSSCRP